MIPGKRWHWPSQKKRDNIDDLTMKKIITSITLLALFVLSSFAQSYNTDSVELGKYIRRMFNSNPFEGVRVVEDYNNAYLISVIIMDKAKNNNNESVMSRVASVKAMAQANRYFNGSDIVAEMIIRTSEDSKGHSDTEIIENIRERSFGYVKEMELLTSFPFKDGCITYVFLKQLSF